MTNLLQPPAEIFVAAMASTDAGQVAMASNGGKREKVDPVTTLQEGIGK
jgi:hypothetical protein